MSYPTVLGRAYTRQAYTPMYALLSSSLTFMRNAISFTCSKSCRVDVESIKALSNVVSFKILIKNNIFLSVQISSSGSVAVQSLSPSCCEKERASGLSKVNTNHSEIRHSFCPSFLQNNDHHHNNCGVLRAAGALHRRAGKVWRQVLSHS